MTIEMFTALFGWCLVINAVFLFLAAIGVMCFIKPIMRIHGKMFGLSDDDLARAYFQYLTNYKIAIIVFNLVPYIALKLLA